MIIKDILYHASVDEIFNNFAQPSDNVLVICPFVAWNDFLVKEYGDIHMGFNNLYIQTIIVHNIQFNVICIHSLYDIAKNNEDYAQNMKNIENRIIKELTLIQINFKKSIITWLHTPKEKDNVHFTLHNDGMLEYTCVRNMLGIFLEVVFENLDRTTQCIVREIDNVTIELNNLKTIVNDIKYELRARIFKDGDDRTALNIFRKHVISDVDQDVTSDRICSTCDKPRKNPKSQY
jgi:hypothetical protein